MDQWNYIFKNTLQLRWQTCTLLTLTAEGAHFTQFWMKVHSGTRIFVMLLVLKLYSHIETTSLTEGPNRLILIIASFVEVTVMTKAK